MDVSRPDEHAARVGTVGFMGSKASRMKDTLMTSKLRPVFRSTFPVTLLSMPRRGTQADRTYDANAARRKKRSSTLRSFMVRVLCQRQTLGYADSSTRVPVLLKQRDWERRLLALMKPRAQRSVFPKRHSAARCWFCDLAYIMM